MREVDVRFIKLDPRAVVPTYATEGDAAADLRSIEDFELLPGERHKFRTGIAVEIPLGYKGTVKPKSGLSDRHGVTVHNTPGTVDAGYRGEVCVLLINEGKEPFNVKVGDKIAQMEIEDVIKAKYVRVDKLDMNTERGAGGFGSTGR